MGSTRTSAVLVLSTLVLAVAASAGAPAVAMTAVGHWHKQTAVDAGKVTIFWAVTTLSTGDAWAVGEVTTNSGALQTLVEHYDGQGWTRQASPNPFDGGELLSVKAVSTTDVWAVGRYLDAGTFGGLILHYDGSQWTQTKLVPEARWFNGVAVHSNDAWAVGDAVGGGGYVEYFNGSSWASQSVPSTGIGSLSSVSAAGPSNVWAVGMGTHAAGPHGPQAAIALHYNGTKWRFQTLPALPEGSWLYGVSVNSADDVWAVGYYPPHLYVERTLIMHWDGATWQQVTPPSDGAKGSLRSVRAVSSSDAWAVGETTQAGIMRTLIEHWDGSGWHVVGSPTGSDDTVLMGVASSGPTNSFAVGFTHIQRKTFVLNCAC